jgi:hypothetical protein
MGEDFFYAMMGIDKSVSTDRPNIDNLFLIFWLSADLQIPWPRDLSPKQAILEWARKEIASEDV